MKIEMKHWEIERIKEIIAKILEFWSFNSIEMKNDSDRTLSMSTKTFLEQLERELNNPNN